VNDDAPELQELLALVTSEEPADLERAQARALSLGKGSPRAKVIAAMAYDRLRALAGRSQKFGTQAVLVDGERRAWPIDGNTTDSERAKWSLAPLAKMREQLADAPLIGKPPLRRLLRRVRAQLSADDVEQRSYAIAEHGEQLLESCAITGTLAAYWPLPGEADPRPLARAIARRRGCKLALPVVDGDDMVFREWRDDAELCDAGFGTLGPSERAPECVPDVVLVPLIGWDFDGARLGQGRGYYDRKLAALPPAHVVGVAFDCQWLPCVPTERHDRRLAAVVTERGGLSFSPLP